LNPIKDIIFPPACWMEDAYANGSLNRISTVRHACPRGSTSAGAEYYLLEVNHELLARHQNSHPAAWRRAHKRSSDLKKTGE
jgi:hypothetical protein